MSEWNDPSLLLATIWWEKRDITELLLEYGADMDCAPGKAQSGLMGACILGGSDLVEHLLDAGADPSASSRQVETPLSAAASLGKLQIIEMLLSRGAHMAIGSTKHEKRAAAAWIFEHAFQGGVEILERLFTELDRIGVSPAQRRVLADAALQAAAHHGKP
jgi:ankyrin repeat protein